METVDKKKMIKGGEFLIRETDASEVFIPEDWTEEQRMISQTCKDFLATEVNPKLDELDSMKNPELMPTLLEKAGELGMLATTLPEKYGGFAMDFNTSMLIAEEFGRGHSFAVAAMAHTGIGTLPIYYYGTDEQKDKYLPKLATGEWKAAYCLTEPDSGSDANAAKTKAVLNEAGTHYILNGQKMWITNGGFADVFTVFAKIDKDEKLTAFIVEKEFAGITMNEEEKKMGIKGSSTRQIFFNDTPVPIENMLSERENGFKIALNILNIGRIKLGIAALGGAKTAMAHAVRYANERKQFGKTIGSFGAMKHKLGDVAAHIYASESAHYRASDNIRNAVQVNIQKGMSESEAKLKATEEYAIECAILKVHGSEVLDYSVDEGVQIFGGMGYSADGPMDRAYRDSRINRIFEGTNEINRMLTIDMLLKKGMKGELDLMGPAMAVVKELTSIPSFGQQESDEVFARQKEVITNLKKAGLMIAGAAIQKFMTSLKDEQEVLMSLSDMLIELYVAESTILRTEKLISMKGAQKCQLQYDLAMVYLHHAVDKATRAGKEAIYAFAKGDEEKMMLMGLKRFTKIDSFNLKEARRHIADHLLAKNDFII